MTSKQGNKGKNAEIKNAILSILYSASGEPVKLIEIDKYVKTSVKKGYSKSNLKMALVNLVLYDDIKKVDNDTYVLGDKKPFNEELMNIIDKKINKNTKSKKVKSDTNKKYKDNSNNGKSKTITCKEVYSTIIDLLENSEDGAIVTSDYLKDYIKTNLGDVTDKRFYMLMSKFVNNHKYKIIRVGRGNYALEGNGDINDNTTIDSNYNVDIAVDENNFNAEKVVNTTVKGGIDSNNDNVVEKPQDIIAKESNNNIDTITSVIEEVISDDDKEKKVVVEENNDTINNSDTRTNKGYAIDENTLESQVDDNCLLEEGNTIIEMTTTNINNSTVSDFSNVIYNPTDTPVAENIREIIILEFDKFIEQIYKEVKNINILDLTESDFHKISMYKNVLRKVKDSLDLLQ